MKSIAECLVCCAMVGSLMAAEPTKLHLFQLRLVLHQPTADSERMIMSSRATDGQPISVVLNVAKSALLDEHDIKSASYQPDPLTGRPRVNITFTDVARKAFAEITRTNVNNQFAILIDGKVIEAPIIRTEIKDGKASIEGNLTREQTEALAQRINKAVKKEQGKMAPWRHGLYDRRTITAP